MYVSKNLRIILVWPMVDLNITQVGYVQTQPERGRFVVLKECYKILSHFLILRGLVMCRLRELGLDNSSSSCFVLSRSSKSLKSPEQIRNSKAEEGKS